jgi:glycosyltransferase involved in cell wall biosynthesis
MRVCFITRRGIWQFQGGEQVQIANTRRVLQAAGVHVDIAEDLPENHLSYDLLHFFAIDRDHVDKIQRAHGVRKLLTPIYWDRYQQYAEAWSARKPPWLTRRVSKLRKWGSGVRQRVEGRGERGAPMKLETGGLYGYASFQAVVDLVDFFLPNSEMEMESVRRNYVFAEAVRYAIVHNAVDATGLDRVSDCYERKFGFPRAVLSSAAIETRKNQCGLVLALQDTDVPIILAGQVRDSRYESALRVLLRRRANVHITGHLPPEDLNSLYRGATVHALPSFHETPGISNLEAIAHGCPNVSTMLGGLEEYVGSYSLYCNPYYLPHIRQQVLAALEQPRSKEAAAFVRARYTWEKAAMETLAGYEEALSLEGPRH